MMPIQQCKNCAMHQLIQLCGSWQYCLTQLLPQQWLKSNVIYLWMLPMINRIDVNMLKPRQNDRHFPDDISKCIFFNENVWIAMNIQLKFVPKGPVNNIPVLVQWMVWHRPGNKPLSEPMMLRLSMHICIIQPRWVNCRTKYS